MMFRWMIVGAAIVVSAVFLFLNRSGMDKEGLAAFQEILAEERIIPLQAELKKHQKSFAEYSRFLQSQLKIKKQADAELMKAENISLPVCQKKSLEKMPSLPEKFSNVSVAENSGRIRKEIEEWKKQIRYKSEERKRYEFLDQSIEEERSQKVFYYKNGKRHEKKKIDSWDYHKRKSEIKNRLAAIQKEIVRLKLKIGERYCQLRNMNIQKSQQENSLAEKQQAAEARNRKITQENTEAQRQFALASAVKQQKIASARKKVREITLAIQTAESKQEEIRKAAELCGRKLMKEKDGLAAKAGLVHACIISEALGGRRLTREFLTAVRKSGAENREMLKLYLNINAPEVAAVLKSREFRKKRGLCAQSMQMEIRDGLLVFEKEEILETAWKLLKEKYQ